MTIFLPNFIKNIFFFSSIAFFVFACKNENQNKLKVSVDRFDKKFQLSDSIELAELKQNYPYFFPSNYPDEVWINRKKDSIQIEIFNQVESIFNENEFLNQKLSNFFSRKKKYYKKFRLPKIISVITDVDYNNRVILTDSILLLGLDNYLGSDHYFYDGLPNFITEDLKKQIKGLSQAIRNAQDGQNLIDTVEGASGEVVVALQRLRELAVQSATDTNSAVDRGFINKEAQNLIAEINRIGSNTQWNGMNVLDGTFVNKQIQAGANVNESIGIAVNDMQIAEDTQLIIGHLCMQWLTRNKPNF